MIYLYIKPEIIKKNDTPTMTSYKWMLYWVITWKLLFGEGDFSGVGNEHLFWCWVGFFFHLQGFPQTVGFEEVVKQSIHGLPINFPHKICLPMKSIFWKKVPPSHKKVKGFPKIRLAAKGTSWNSNIYQRSFLGKILP